MDKPPGSPHCAVRRNGTHRTVPGGTALRPRPERGVAVRRRPPPVPRAAETGGRFLRRGTATVHPAPRPEGHSLSERVWEALQRLPFGETVSYGDTCLTNRRTRRIPGRWRRGGQKTSAPAASLPPRSRPGRHTPGFCRGNGAETRSPGVRAADSPGGRDAPRRPLRSTNGEMPCPAALSALPEAGLPAGPLGDGEGVRP